MAGAKADRVAVTCPRCGNIQHEPRAVVSTVCRTCQTHIQVKTAAHSGPSPLGNGQRGPVRSVTCFRCGTLLDVVPQAESTMCKRCGDYVDLRDYIITSAVSKNFRTHGRFVVEEKGYVINADCEVGEAVVKGRFIGNLRARDRLEIHTGAHLQGSFQTALLVIPSGQVFRRPHPLHVGGAEISGEFVTDLRVDKTVTLKSTARFFGDILAAHLVVEPGALLVGSLRIGTAP
jgi:cytoskeletal protein CcmA (bactofilin family)